MKSIYNVRARRCVWLILALVFLGGQGTRCQGILDHYRAGIAWERNDRKEAVGYWDKILIQEPFDPVARYNRSKIAYQEKDYVGALAHLNDAQRGCKDNSDLLVQILFDTGNALVKLKKYREALGAYRDVVARVSDHKEALDMINQLEKLLESQDQEKKQEKDDQEGKQDSQDNKEQDENSSDKDSQEGNSQENPDKDDSDSQGGSDKKDRDKDSGQPKKNTPDTSDGSQNKEDTKNNQQERDQKQNSQEKKSGNSDRQKDQEKTGTDERQEPRAQDSGKPGQPGELGDGADHNDPHKQDSKEEALLRALEHDEAQALKDMVKASVSKEMVGGYGQKNW